MRKKESKIGGISGLARLGINKLLILGFGVSLAALIIVGFVAWRSFTGISSNIESVAENAKNSQNVNNDLEVVADNTKEASESAKLIIENVDNSILPSIKSNVQDIAIIEETFDEIANNFAELIKQEDLDVDTFLFEAEDILESIKRESLPLVRTVKASIEVSEKQIYAMKDSLIDFDARLGLLVETSGKVSRAFKVTQEGVLNAYEKAVTTKGIMSVLIIVFVFLVAGFSIIIRNAICKPIKKVIGFLSEASDQVASASNQISQSSQLLAQNASEQASSIEETSASMEQMSSVTRQNANNSQEAAKLVDMCSLAAENGNEAVGEMSSSMEEINESNKKIAEITKVIDGIAFQTNLLALNAAVEAARAGEHGKGFAVVAEEVRNLAQRSASAAKDTTSLIEDCVTKADNGAKVAVKCKESLEDIVKNVKKATDLTKEITNASSEQSKGIDQVNNAVHQMDQTTQRNAASAEETASASEQLSAQSQNMMEQVEVLSAQVGSSNGNGSAHITREDANSTPRALPVGKIETGTHV